MSWNIRIGKPTHLKGATYSFAACGVCAAYVTDDVSKVDCIRCRRMKQFKLLKKQHENT